MRLRRPRGGWRRPIHFCGWDSECRGMHSPWYLYLHFLDAGDNPVRFDLSPPWVRRRNQIWWESLQWEETRGPLWADLEWEDDDGKQ